MVYTLAEAQMLSNFKKTPRDSATTLPSVQKNESCMTHNQNTCLNAFLFLFNVSPGPLKSKPLRFGLF